MGPVVYIYRRPVPLGAVSLCPLSLVLPARSFVIARSCVPLPASVARCFVPPRLGHPLSMRYTETPIKTLLLSPPCK